MTPSPQEEDSRTCTNKKEGIHRHWSRHLLSTLHANPLHHLQTQPSYPLLSHSHALSHYLTLHTNSSRALLAARASHSISTLSSRRQNDNHTSVPPGTSSVLVKSNSTNVRATAPSHIQFCLDALNWIDHMCCRLCCYLFLLLPSPLLRPSPFSYACIYTYIHTYSVCLPPKAGKEVGSGVGKGGLPQPSP